MYVCSLMGFLFPSYRYFLFLQIPSNNLNNTLIIDSKNTSFQKASKQASRSKLAKNKSSLLNHMTEQCILYTEYCKSSRTEPRTDDAKDVK